MSRIEQIVAGTAFEIVARSFSRSDDSERKFFRLKNLTRTETMQFLCVWQQSNINRGLERVRLLVASDSHEDFPKEFRADPKYAITYYRNQNPLGLVYIETKVESDEQGLKNIFTLRDVNFLDGTFDEASEFSVSKEMVRQALRYAGSTNPEGNELFRDRLLDVHSQLVAEGMTIPMRKFTHFVLSAAEELVSQSHVYTPEDTDALVGRHLIHLGLFPDEQWRQNEGRIARRLTLNLLRAELAASPSSDLDPEKISQDCFRTKFLDEEGERYEPEIEAGKRQECSEYCFDPSSERRAKIPYRIFEQVFSKDVKGLPLGLRLAEDIVDCDPSRKSEYDDLSVESGLNNRSADDARKFLEYESAHENALPLKDLLSKQTLRMVEKLASPSVERIQNPLIKLSQVAADLRARNNLELGEFRIELRAGAGTTVQHEPTLGLFAFIYGKSLLEIHSLLSDGVGSVFFDIDERLWKRRAVPPLKREIEPDGENLETSSSEEEEGTLWLPIPLEFVLVNAEDGSEIDSEVAVEWLPDDLHYLALFWISLCGEDRADISAEIYAPSNRGGETWITEVAHRFFPLATNRANPISEDVLKNPIIDRLVEIRTRFRNKAEREGLSIGLMNDVFDEWSALLADARRTFVPVGDVPLGMIEFMNADCIQEFDGDRVLMLQSHPLKLRWISAYLAKSSQLATDAIEGSLRLNEQNENLYLNWIQGLSPHQQPSIHTAAEGHILFADGERGWTESFQKTVSSGGAASGDRIHASLIAEIVRQIRAYLHAHPYKADGLSVLVVTGSASALPADIVQGVRKGEFKNLAMTIELVAPKDCWSDASRNFELIDTENRLSGEGAFLPSVQLNLHDLVAVRADFDLTLKDLVCDLAIVPQFLDDNISTDAKTEDETSTLGKFDPLLDDPTYIASGAGSSALWVSLRPKMPDIALSDWSTLAVRHARRNPVAADRPEATDFIDIRVNFHHTAQLFTALHKISHWVITVERHITREQIEKLETRPEVLSVRDGVGPGALFTLIVSSNTGKKFVIARLTRKLKRIAESIGRAELAEKQANLLAQKIYDEARQISPRLTLDALGISRVTEEILGLSIARQVAEGLTPDAVKDGFIAWISLDEHPEWFVSTHAMRADMIRLTVSRSDSGLIVDILVLESKLRRSGYDSHGAEQVRKTLKMFDAVFPKGEEQDPMDGKLWRDTILSAVDTVSEEAFFISQELGSDQRPRRSRVPEDIRSRFREGDFASVTLTGLYSICEYSHPRELTRSLYDIEPRIQIIQTGGNALLDSSEGVLGFKRLSNQDADVCGGVGRKSTPVQSKSEDEIGLDFKGEVCPEPIFEDSNTHSERTIKEQNITRSARGHLGKAELDRRYQVILDTFGQYGISVNKTDVSVEYAIEGPASILFRIRPGKGVDPRKLSEKRDALKLALELESSQDMRFDIDKGYVTIDVPKLDEDRYFVTANDLWSHWQRPEFGLTVPIGEDRFGGIVQIDFSSSNSPHLLIGGTTGSGKSEALSTILAGLTKHYSPVEVRLQLIDPKGTELDHFSKSEHVDGDIGWDDEDAIKILARAVEEMQDRYLKFKGAKVRTLEDYNSKVSWEVRMPRWVIVLDEYADLTSEPDAKKTIEANLKRLAQKARAAGIHVIIATQKPDASVISTNLRSNLPAQLALRVKSAIESRVIMDDPGAESLTGKGDAFFKEGGVLTRVQCAKV